MMRKALVLVSAVVMLAVVAGADSGYREIPVTETSIPTISCEVGYSCTIMFPTDEEVVNTLLGDGAVIPAGEKTEAIPTWVIVPYRNTVGITVTKQHVRTSLSVGTKTSDGVYRVIAVKLAEGSNPDIKVVMLRQKQPDAKSTAPSGEVEKLKREIAAAEAELAQQRQMLAVAEAGWEMDRKAHAGQVDPNKLMNMTSVYVLGKHAAESPFNVSKIVGNSKVTYIYSASLEVPAFYAMRDGKLALTQYKYDAQNKRYVIPQVVDHGAMVMGKKKLEFYRVN